MEAIPYFRGEYQFLSNFAIAIVHYDGFNWPSAENAYQAMKTLDPKIRTEFRSPAMSPAMAKRYARTLKLREDWDQVKDGIMLDIVREKFKIPRMQSALLRTGTRYLTEGNSWHDTYWGVCDGNHAPFQDVPAHPNVSIGSNKLGKILERVRFEFWLGQNLGLSSMADPEAAI